jgi:hypothetical protein
MKTTLFGMAFAAAAAAQTFTVSGVVTDAVHGGPLARARVMLSGGNPARRALTTSGDGRFSFEVSQGKYSLFAEHNGWRIQYGNREPLAGWGSAIITGPNQDTAHLTLAWYAPGSISGTLKDEQGDAVRSATVQLIRAWVVSGRKRLLPAGSAQTDDRGEYRFGPLAAGNYYIVATGLPWYSTLQRLAPVLLASEPQPPTAAYPPTYYSGTNDPTEAVALTLQAGAELRADLSLQATLGATVHLRCPGSGMVNEFCQGAPTLSLHGIGDMEFSPAVRFEGGGYVGVPPGRYTVRLAVNGKAASRVFDVTAGDLTVDLNMRPRAPITGTVTLNSSTSLPKSGVYLNLENETTGRGVATVVGPSGAFYYTNAGGARFRPYFYGTVPLAIVRLSLNGSILTDEVLDLTDKTDARIEILATDELGGLKGFVLNREQPVPGAMVVLAPAKDSKIPAAYRGFQTDSDGSFDYVNIPAGDYLLFATSNLELEYTNSEVIKPYLANALPIRIVSHQVGEQRIQLVVSNKSANQ